MAKKTKKYGFGSKGVGGKYIVNPSTTMAQNQINMAKADAEANSNPWIPITLGAGQLLSSYLAGKQGEPKQDIGQGEGTNMATNQGELDGKWMDASQTDTFLNDIGMAAFGNDGSSEVSEIEGEEVIETPDGQVGEVKGPSHEQGGVDANLPQGTKIYSKRVEKFGESMAERKVIREKKKANLQKLLSDNKDDIAIRNAHSRTIEALEEQEAEDLEMQGMYGMMAAMQEFAYGTGKEGTMKYDVGTNKYGVRPRTLPDAPLEDTERPSILNDFSSDIYTPQLSSPGTEATGVIDGMEKYYQDSQKKPSVAGKFNLPTSNDDESSTDNNHLGDAIGMAGNIYSAFAPMQNTLENRATDTPNINTFKDFGKDSLDANLSAMDFAASNKSSNIRRIMSQANGSKRAGRNSARGVNQMRAMDIATDLGANDAQQSANDSYVNTMTQLFGMKSQLENAQDGAVMAGEQARDLADRQDKDNFYTQKGKDIATKGEGIQTMGKDLNKIEENKMMMNIMNNLSKYGLAFDKNGNIVETTNKQAV